MDVVGNESDPSDSLTITEATPGDTTAPTSSNIQARDITTTGATITWTTNEAGTSQVEYGLTSEYGMLTTLNSSLVTSHSVALTGLASGTTYHFRVASTDEFGNTASSTDAIFTTGVVSDETPPPAPGITTTDTTVNADTYLIIGTAGADTPSDSIRTVTLWNGTSLAGSATLSVGQTDWAILASLNQNTTNSFTASSTDAYGNSSLASSAVIITEDPEFGADEVAPEVPVITTSAITVDSASYTISGTAGDDGGVRLVRLYNGTTLVGTASLVAGETDWSFNIALNQNTDNSFTATSADAVGNVSDASSAVVITEEEAVANLAVTSIDLLKSSATADNTFESGWQWKFHITVPTSETTLNMKFADFISGSNTLASASNIRLYSDESANASTTDSAITITTADTYSDDMLLEDDLDTDTAGRQIEVMVEVKVPSGTPGGSYSTSYGVKSL